MTALLLLLQLVGQSTNLEVGMEAPDFSLRDQSGIIRSLGAYRGKTVVLMFYPKDQTSGCSCQAKAARDLVPALTAKNVAVLSVNSDDVGSHAAFAEKEGLNYPLLADPDRVVLKRYGVLGANGLAQRVTYVIDPNGKIAGIDRKVDETFARKDGELKTTHLDDIDQFVSPWKARVGERVPNLWMAGEDGKTVSIRPRSGVVTVLLFLGSDDLSRNCVPVLADIVNSPAYEKASFYAINPNQGWGSLPTPENRWGLKWLFDPLKSTSAHFEVTHTPSVCMVDGMGNVRYFGSLDTPGKAFEGKATIFRQALLALMEGRPFHSMAAPSFGTPVVAGDSVR